MATAAVIENAKRAADVKVYAWAAVQTGAMRKKEAARAAGNAGLAAIYFEAEVKAANKRYRHETAIDTLCTMERRAAEQAAWDARSKK